MSVHRGLHTLLNYRNFIIPSRHLESSYENTRVICRHYLRKNNLRVVNECSSLLNDNRSPEGWTMCFLLDESHLSLHSYTSLGLLAIDLFTCSPTPENHTNCVEDINKYIINSYNSELIDKQTITTRF